ncbi:hypothetical protein [Citricoccus sp. I39-566]|uniref:hypothetical protein n=1 Tax=Citricoccus sp. I39-566 TaxID=3073268 RepID=UPI00286BE1DC|nr:hypothetical protein [Citricoccus sp. I39-566]WMY79569.1 hypothetical protein RE421_06860 [Citricoccus sp. I39-566]
MQSVESGSNRNAGQAGSGPRGLGWASRGSGITFAVMVLILLVALLFAANQNDVIGWLLVAISAGWLVLAVLVVLGVRRGARSVDRQMKNFSATLAPRVQDQGTTPAPAPGPSASPAAADPMRDTKLDHSFKIVQVQARVVTEELDKGSAADTDMVTRALETIHITSSNARDMLQGSEGTKRSTGSTGSAGSDGPISGEVIN